MKELSLLGVFFVAAAGILLSPVQFTFPILAIALLVLIALYFGNLPTGIGEAERRLQSQIDATQRRLAEIENDINRKLAVSTSRIEVVEQSCGHRLSLNEDAIRGLTSTLEQRYIRLEHDFIKKIGRIEQRLKSSQNPTPPSLSLVSAGLLVFLTALIAVPLWWNFPFRSTPIFMPTVQARILDQMPASQDDARAQLRTPELEGLADSEERASLVQKKDEQVLVEIKELLASTIRPLEKCVSQVTELSEDNKQLSQSYHAQVSKLESQVQECASKLKVSNKIISEQRRIWFGEG